MRFSSLFCSAVAAAFLLTGCVSTSLETNARMSQSVFLEPVEASKRIVFLNIKNTSGQSISLAPKIAQMLISRGYQITDNPNQATYILSTNILYCDKKQENNAAAAATLGAGIGTSIGAYNHTHASAVAANAALGGLVGGLVGKLTEDTVYQMQVDINIKERREGGVQALKTSTQGQAKVTDNQRSGFMNSFAGPIRSNASGELNSNLANQSAQSYKSDFIEHNTVMFAEAIKMNLNLAEAIPVLEDKIASQIAGLF